MKKHYLLVSVALLFAVTVSAQNTFNKGDKVANIGVGIGTYVDYGKTTFPPLSVSFEYGVKDNLFNEKSSLGIGGFASYFSTNDKYSFEGLGDYGYKYTFINLGARGLLHYQLVKKLDTYVGVMLGYSIGSSKVYGDYSDINASASVGGFEYSTFLGARYYFANNIAAYAELGYGITILDLGVSFKL